MRKDKDNDNENEKYDIDNENLNKQYSDAKIFLQNLSKEVSKVHGNPEEIERLNFTIRGRELSAEAKLTYERIRIVDYFAHHFEPSIDFVRFNRLRSMIESLSEAIKSRNYEYEAIARIIVQIELELGMNVLLTTILLELAKDDINEKQYRDIDKTDFEKLYDYFVEKSQGRKRRR